MKYVIIKGISIFLIVFCIQGCSQAEPPSQSSKLKVVTTLFPYYDFVRQISKDQAEVHMVIPAGMDSHSFEPTPADMITIQNADIVICNGGEMEQWLLQVLSTVDTKQMTVVKMMDYIDTVEEVRVEGMEEQEEEHHHEEHHHESDGHEMQIEYDEHIWTSPVNAMKIVAVINEVLGEADPTHKAEYQKRTDSYLKNLEQIHQGFLTVVKQKKRDMIIVGDKFPFRYLADEYGLDYRAAFTGCSTDTEPSARTIAYLIDKIKQERIPVIYYLELSSHRVSEIIGEETGAIPLLLHSCHNVTRKEFEDGVTYLQLMEQNVENLRRGLDE